MKILLGESNPQELYETTIGPDRDLIQLNVSDVESTESLMEKLFKSSETEARRELMRKFLHED